MNWPARLRTQSRRWLASAGVLDATRAARRRAWLTFDTGLRQRDRQHREEFAAFEARYRGSLSARLNAGTRQRGVNALVVGSRCPTLETELVVIKALEVAGFSPAVVTRDSHRGLRPYYRLAGVEDVHVWSEFAGASSHSEALAESLIAGCLRLEDVLTIEHEGVRVGRIAASTAIRQRRVGTVELDRQDERDDLIRRLAFSLASSAEATRILDRTAPSLVVFVDTEYSPTAELFDRCLDAGIDAVAYDAGQQTNTLVFKRYRRRNRADHLSTLSEKTWASVRRAPWGAGRSGRLSHTLAEAYASGDWYRACWTQASKRPLDTGSLRGRLGLRSGRKAAFIFAHILWDAPLSWGHTLFTTYQDWLLATVRAACVNSTVDWVIKIHPANVGKRLKEGYRDEPAETRVLRDQLGTLPGHVRLLDPTFDVSTTSLFSIMDYCLTVRGTVGIEAARLGIPVLTAGTGRYGGRGFTVDSSSIDEYQQRLAHIQDIPRLTAEQQDLADRFAFGFFACRPLTMSSVTWDFGQPGERSRAAIHLGTRQEWMHAKDVARLSRWLGESDDEDLVASDMDWDGAPA